MTGEMITAWYLILGIITAFINGAVRKLEADMLLGLVWILAWWMTPIALLIRFVVHIYKALKNYQPYRRTRIYFLRYF